MNRDEFLSQTWRPYPDQRQIPQNALCGRIQEIGGDQIRIKSGEDFFTLDKPKVRTGESPELGRSCPPGVLKCGDWVAWIEPQSLLFMLSPCLNEKLPLFDSEAKAWSDFLSRVEKYFVGEGFVHLRTPYLVVSPGVDHHIDFLKVKATGTGREWTLPTSPEIHLKKYLCQGYEKIFEIKNCFRDDLPGPQHSAEFTMLEWYQAFADLNQLAQVLEKMLQTLTEQSMNLECTSLAQIFYAETGYRLTPQTGAEELRQWAESLAIETREDDDWNDLFFRIFMEKVEPTLGQGAPILLRDFPAQQASLAKINKEGWAERMELYWNGVELANAYLEVNDPTENRRRFSQEAELRSNASAALAPQDEDFFAYLESGMPPAAGMALGLNRLFSLIRNRNTLSN